MRQAPGLVLASSAAVVLLAVLASLMAPAQAQSLLDELEPLFAPADPDAPGAADPDDPFVLPQFTFSGERSSNSDAAEYAVLRALDTITGRVENLTVKVGDVVEWERLEINLLSCRHPRGDIDTDAYALLQIRDVREADPRFTGWMIASSPALSSLDHPRYDVWVLRCSNA